MQKLLAFKDCQTQTTWRNWLKIVQLSFDGLDLRKNNIDLTLVRNFLLLSINFQPPLVLLIILF